MDNLSGAINVLTFRMGDEQYAASVRDISEVVQISNEIVPVPGTPEQVIGVMNLRGNVITVLDLRQVVGLAADKDTSRPIVVATIDGHTVGLMVDEVSTVTEIEADDTEEPPNLGRANEEGLVKRLIHRDDALYLLIDLNFLPLNDAQLAVNGTSDT